MLGFLIGTLCLVGLIKLVRAGRRGPCAHGRCGHGWHGGPHRRCHDPHHGHHHEPRHGWRRERGGRGWWLRRLFEDLDTSPGQEKVIAQAVEEVFAATRGARGELEASRRDVAEALRAGSVDEVRLGELFARHDEKLSELRKTVVGALARVSDALDADQRARLADLVERGLGGRGWRRFGGPYREPGRGPTEGQWA